MDSAGGAQPTHMALDREKPNECTLEKIIHQCVGPGREITSNGTELYRSRVLVHMQRHDLDSKYLGP